MKGVCGKGWWGDLRQGGRGVKETVKDWRKQRTYKSGQVPKEELGQGKRKEGQGAERKIEKQEEDGGKKMKSH